MLRNFFKKLYVSKNYDVFFFKFIFYFFKIFGTLPISYDYEWKSENESRILLFKISKVGVGYNIVLIFFLLFSNIFQLYFIYYLNYFFYTEKIESLVIGTMSYLRVFFIVVILSVFVFQHSKMVLIAKKINELRIMATQQLSIKIKVVSISIGNLAIAFTLKIILIYYILKTVPIETLIELIVYVLFIQYIFVLKIIQSFYKHINDTLQKLFLKQSGSAFENLSLALKINKLMSIYSSSCDLSQELSNFYSLPMMFATLNTYIHLLRSSYSFIKRVFISTIPNDSFILKNSISFINLYITILLITELVINVTHTITEVNNIIDY